MVMWHAGNGWHHDTRWVGAAVGVEEGPVWSQCAVTFPLPLPLGHIVEQGLLSSHTSFWAAGVGLVCSTALLEEVGERLMTVYEMGPPRRTWYVSGEEPLIRLMSELPWLVDVGGEDH